MISRAFIVALVFILCLSSCSRKDVPQAIARSTSYLDEGNLEQAIQSARNLSSDAPDASKFMVAQYFIFKSLKDHRETKELRNQMENLLELDLSNAGLWTKKYVAAKAFARVGLAGVAAAKDSLAQDCHARLKKQETKACVYEILSETLGIYLPSHDRFESITLYEIAQAGADTGFLTESARRFYSSLALVDVDNARSAELIRSVEREGHLPPNKRAMYCLFMKDSRTTHPAIACGN